MTDLTMMQEDQSDLALMSAAALTARFRTGDASPVEAAEAALDRIDRFQESHNAFIIVDRDGALRAARASEERWRKGDPIGPIDGVTATIKDLIVTKGWPTRRGSKTIDPDQPWDDDAPSVARLREGGATILGKTTTPELGWKGVTDSPLTGVTGNPWNPERTPGGSSGGAAVAAALGMGHLNLGTDGGGSVRIPAGFSGIFGIKASFGRVAAWPLSPFGTLANVGPMTRTVADGALLLDVLAQEDWRDWYNLPPAGESFLASLDDGIDGARVAFSPDLGGNPVEPGVAEAVAQAASAFADFGATLEQAEPDVSDAGEIFMTHWFAGASVMIHDLPPEKQELVDPGLREVAKLGAEYSTADYIKAMQARRELGYRVNQFFQDYDLLLTPTLPLVAFPVGLNAPQRDGVRSWVNWTPFSYPFNLSRHPAATVPCGLVDGLPVGLQIVGRPYQDALVMQAARAFEKAHPWPLPPAAIL